MRTIDVSELEKTKGWIVGNFQNPVLQTDFEVGLKLYKKNEENPCHAHFECNEINIILYGKGKFIDTEGTCYVVDKNQIIVIEPQEFFAFKAVEDTLVLVIKDKSNPKDKIIWQN